MCPVQVPSIVLPAVPIRTGAEIETVTDLLVHTGIEFTISYIQEKNINIVATEIVAAGVPGPLWAWVELSPVPTTSSGAYWYAIGGGGGTLAPIAPVIIAPTGVNLTVHTFSIPWTMHSAYARLCVQTPVAGTPLTAFWTVQAIFTGKGD